MQDIRIGNITVGEKHKPFIIAEMSGNHNQSLDRAMAIIDAAADAGAHAIKLQTYTADTLTINYSKGLFYIEDQSSLWKGRNLYDLYKQAYTPWEWHKPIFEHAAKRGLLAFSSPFDETSVDFLEELNVPAYKIASFENNHHPLLKKVAKTGKPVIMSTGLSNVSDVDESVRVLRDAGCKDIILLKCTSTYPSTPENTHVNTIPHMQAIFNCQVGLSDHTMGIGAAIAAVALGARVVEKHFTLRRADGGVDSAFSLEPEEMAALVTETERAFLSLGQVQLCIQKSEEKSIRFKRSIYVVEDIKAGETFTEKNIRVIRPGDGLHPRYFESLLGKKAKLDIEAGTPLTFDLF
ncbi:MAG: pseudaminic acid synthase [Sphingobacteriales bacterium]|nr:MAG: pseudaminic acid synthase [Sphingobacteriales bacterium]